MTPTLSGRIQSRIFLALLIGVPWTILLTPFLPGIRIDGEGFVGFGPGMYPVTFTALGLMIVLGAVVWDPLYHGLQQFRWERDWPSMFALLTVINEAVLLWFVLSAVGVDGGGRAQMSTFVVHIATTWLLMWLFAVGPIRVLLLRYRFSGGRILRRW